MKNLTLLSLLAVTGLSACNSPTPIPENGASASIYAITNVTVVDVEKGILIPERTLLIVNARIDKIGPYEKIKIPQGATVIDGQGLYLMPGLVDAHVHYYDAPVFGRVLLANGVLLVRDMGMPNEYILPLRDQLNRGETLGPEMIATGAVLDGNSPVIPTISISVSTPEQGRAAVQAQIAAGANMIKVYSKLDQAVFLAIVEEAQRSEIQVVGHVPDTVYIEDAAAAGQSSIEHWFGFDKVIARLLGEQVEFQYTGIGSGFGYLLRLCEVDPQALQDVYRGLKKSGVTLDPTVVIFRNWPNMDSLELQSLPHSEYISHDLFSMWKTQWAGQTEFPDLFWQNWAQMVRQMNEAGIPLTIGTDLMCPGLIPGYSVHEEMQIWQEAGIPPADILRSATLVPAQFMGLENRLGSIQEGKSASMILVRGNPLEDIRNAQQIESIFLRGKYFNREDLDQLLAEARELAKQPVNP
ncbi:MAG TPA: amidohydrolase family protein [Anaerolineales bacterium]|nr:hypothetical protein [Anaerolineae bacterium]HRJ58616.1 amidohydrolase family protein [Anaerolineales bacterium]HRK90116.1 amidohydrolase family protein [Anaerolineales bacterium]